MATERIQQRFRLPPDVYVDLLQVSDALGVSINEVATNALRRYLREQIAALELRV